MDVYSGNSGSFPLGHRVPDLLDGLKAEFETVRREAEVFKAQKEDYERKSTPPLLMRVLNCCSSELHYRNAECSRSVVRVGAVAHPS